MEEIMIVGYQWRDDMSFAGAYSFPNNRDKVEVHMPPNTTLIAPPITAANEIAHWDGIEWVVSVIPSRLEQ